MHAPCMKIRPKKVKITKSGGHTFSFMDVAILHLPCEIHGRIRPNFDIEIKLQICNCTTQKVVLHDLYIFRFMKETLTVKDGHQNSTSKPANQEIHFLKHCLLPGKWAPVT